MGVFRLPTQKIQIIKRKIDLSHFDGAYFKQIRSGLKKTRNSNAELLFIEFVPNAPIHEKSVLKSLLHLQREFTDILIAPKTSFQLNDMEIQELKERFDATMIMLAT